MDIEGNATVLKADMDLYQTDTAILTDPDSVNHYSPEAMDQMVHLATKARLDAHKRAAWLGLLVNDLLLFGAQRQGLEVLLFTEKQLGKDIPEPPDPVLKHRPQPPPPQPPSPQPVPPSPPKPSPSPTPVPKPQPKTSQLSTPEKTQQQFPNR